MKIVRFCVLVCVGLAIVNAEAQEGAPQPIQPGKPTVAVPYFENRTQGSSSMQGKGEWKLPSTAAKIAADATSQQLTSSRRFNVLDRSEFGLRQVGEETKFSATSGNEDNLIKICKEKNADILLIGSLSNFRISEKKATAYGVERRLVNTRITMDLKAVDVKTGEVAYQASPKKSVSIKVPEGAVIDDIYDWETILREAIQEAADDMILELAKGTGASTVGLEMVTIHVSSTPPGADIIIDDDFAGNTPADVQVDKGRHIIRVERQGYQPWQRNIKAYDGFKISPTLEKVASQSPKLELEVQDAE